MKKALLFGYGSIGRRHADILANKFGFQVDIVTKQQLKEFICYKNVSEIEVLDDYVYYLITSSTNLHYEQLNYLNSRLTNKKIFIEKPIFDKFHDFFLKNDVYVGYDLRYTFVLEKLIEIVNNAHILFIQSYVGQYLPTWRKNIDYTNSYSASKERGGGVLLDLSHELDYIQYLCGEINDLKNYSDKISDLKIDSDDVFTAIGKTCNGTIINVTMDYISKQPMRFCIIHLQDKTLYADFINNTIKVSDKFAVAYNIQLEEEQENYSYCRMHNDILRDDINLKKVCTYEEALNIVKLIEKVRRS